MSSSLSPAGRLFAIAAFAEGLTWAGLLVGMLLKYGNLSQPALDEVTLTAVQTASNQAWRRSLLAWLGVQIKSAESKGDATQVESLKRRIDLILNTVV